MKKPDFDKLKKQATDLSSEAAKTAGGIKKGVQTGIEVSKAAIQKAGEIVNRENLSTGIDAVAKGTETVGKSLEKASTQLKKMSRKLKG